MAKKAKKKKIPLWKWIVILVPLIIGIIWVISILSLYNDIPVVYEQASPGGINALIILVFIFIISYGTFVFLRIQGR